MTSRSAIEQCVRIIQTKWTKRRPRAAVILGTGLGGLTSHFHIEATFAYAELPSFQQPTAVAHCGQLVCGVLGGVPMIAFQGRVHFYEQFTFAQITHPVHVAAALGCELLIVSNASGGLNPQYRSGDIMVLEDHIDLMGGRNAFSLKQRSARSSTGSEARRTGSRNASSLEQRSAPIRVKPSTPYDSELATIALGIGRRQNFACHQGVYVGVTGPNYETRAEYRFLRRIGGDVVGMSTVPEVVAAAEAGMRVLALSAVTNVAKPDAPDTVDALEVVDIAETAEPKLR
ncbi:MAG: purine-nucleoside phosphorylase, partial [Pirellulaceae bacterium]